MASTQDDMNGTVARLTNTILAASHQQANGDEEGVCSPYSSNITSINSLLAVLL